MFVNHWFQHLVSFYQGDWKSFSPVICTELPQFLDAGGFLFASGAFTFFFLNLGESDLIIRKHSSLFFDEPLNFIVVALLHDPFYLSVQSILNSSFRISCPASFSVLFHWWWWALLVQMNKTRPHHDTTSTTADQTTAYRSQPLGGQ